MKVVSRLRVVSSKVRALAGLSVVALVALSLAVFSGNLQAAPTGLPSGFTATPLINHSMMAPTSVRVAPDGRIFVFDLFGSIKLFNPSTGFASTPFATLTVHATGDRGLLGATFDRDFANNPYLYVHYVGADDKVRIARFNASGNVGTGFTDIYTAPEASGFQHAGGGITMGPDDRIYFGIGDSGTPTNSQDLTKIHGKIHRINRDGTVPANPFAGQAGVANTIYAYGVRNPFRMTTDSANGNVYVGDVGFNTWEEINLVQSGKNYGWATQEGPCASACAFENPVYWYPHQFGTNNTNDASITAGPVYRGSLYPASYQGKMFISDYVQGFMRTINPIVASDSFTGLSTGNGSVVDMDVGPDGKLYFITITSPTLYRLDYNSGSANVAPTAAASASVTTGNAPLDVNFSSAGSSDPDGQALTYNWNFGDGTTSTQANPSKTFTQEGEYTVTLQVSDGTYIVPATPITIQVGEQPTVTITGPTATTKYNGGQVINYSASATDHHGNPIADSNLKTTIRLYHSDHNHPFIGPVTGGSGQFTTPTNGELSPDVWIRITVEATDGHGVTGSTFVEIHPNKATMTVNTNLAGLNVVLDGSNHVIPPTVQGVVGMTRQIAAPSPQMLNGIQYVFSHWSDGGAQDHTLTFPSTNTTYTAHYVPATGGTVYTNVVLNPSFETLGSNNLPSNWAASKWGTNNALYSVSSDAHTGNRSARMEITSYSSGEDRLYHTGVNVAPNTVHNVRYYYKSNVQTKAVADVTLIDNTHKYIWLGMNQPSSGDSWREQNWALTTPANAKSVVVSLYLVSAGFFQVDDFNLLAPTSGGGDPDPVVVAPVVTLNANQTTITAGQSTTLAWSTTGTTPSCTASGGWSGTQSASGSLSVSPTSTTTYTLTCTNSAGTDTKSVTVTVNPVVTPPSGGNIAPNPSFEQEDASHNTTGWRKAKWGTNDGVFSVVHGSAFDGNHHVKAAITSFTSGEASWSFVPQTVTGNTVYTVALYAKSTGPTKVLADVTLTDGTHKYLWLGTLPASTTDWKVFTKNFTTPANAVAVTVGAYLTGIGSIELDQFTVSPPSVAPVITFSANPTTITAGQNSTLTWSVTGGPLCTASGAWNGGIASNGSIVVTPSVTSTYTLTCTNSVGTDTRSVTVTVDSGGGPVIPPTPTNLIANASMEDDPESTGVPLGWYSGGWGTNTTAYSYETTGRTGKSLMITIADHVSGDAKWFFEPTAITAGTNYTFTSWYKSSANTEMVLEYTMSDGTKSYFWLGVVAPAADWTQVTHAITPPAGATKITVQHVLKGNGTLQLDDYSLVAN